MTSSPRRGSFLGSLCCLLLVSGALPCEAGAQQSALRILVRMRSAAGMASASDSLARRSGAAGVESLLPEIRIGAFRRPAGPLPGGSLPAPAAERAAHRSRLGLDRWVVLTFPAGEDPAAIMARLREDPLVDRVEPDPIGRAGDGSFTLRTAYRPSDPLFGEQWYLDEPGDHDIDMPEAWDLLRDATTVPVAVLDTGAARTHPDLKDVLLAEWGWDFVNGDDDPSDDAGHGTHVTGLLAAWSDDGIGIAGAAFRTVVVPIKVLGADRSGFYSWWASGIIYATDIGARVINISAAGVANSTLLHDAVEYAHDRGVVICAAMYNDDTDTPYYPAAFSETIAVGATDIRDRRASPFSGDPSGTSGSNWGPHIDLVAPGDSLLSTYPPAGYAVGSGTSQATPLVSGVAALLFAADPTLGPEEIRTILREGADDQVGDPAEDMAGFDDYYGWGRLNAHASLVAALPAGPVFPAATVSVRPNPSQGLVRFAYGLTAPAARVSLRIYDVRGRLVRVILEGAARSAGDHEELWDGTAGNGRRLPAGIYLYELVVDGQRITGKLIRLR